MPLRKAVLSDVYHGISVLGRLAPYKADVDRVCRRAIAVINEQLRPDNLMDPHENWELIFRFL